MRTICTLEARMGSTRIPGKMMKELVDGKPTIEIVIERLKRVSAIDAIVLATTDKPRDDVLAEQAERLGIDLHRGSEDDVLQRVLTAGQKHDADVICEITGDCPLHDPELIDQMISCYHDNQRMDYISNVLQRNWPHGLDIEVFPIESLEQTAAATTDESHREHVTSYIRSNTDEFDVFNISPPPTLNAPELRITLDYEEDLRLIREVLSRIYNDGEFDAYDIVNLFEDDPDLREVNAKRNQFA